MLNTRVRFIEEIAANAWPAGVNQRVDGWHMRFNWGVTQRANSVLPNECVGELKVEERIAIAEAFYAAHGMRARFQLSPASLPAELDIALAARGYARVSDTSVQVAPVEQVMENTAGQRAMFDVSVSNLNDIWMDAYAQAGQMGEHERAMRHGIVQRIGPPAGFALARLDGQPVAVGMGVTERGWMGVFCMDTLPAFRRLGAATAILRSLAMWGRECGATQMYLQVMEINAPAVALYARAGFEPLYTYHYREAVE